AAPRESAFLWRALRLRPGSPVLDICCGTGRHALRLARRGALVTGVDATPEYLARARRSARGLRRLTLELADMRQLPYISAFDAAYNVWTSFGYFRKPADDLRALRAAAGALRPGGLFVIDVVDGDWLRKRWAVSPRHWVELAGGGYRLEQASLRGGADPAQWCEWTVLPPRGQPRRARFFLRLYNEARLRSLLRRAGFDVLKRFHSLGGAPSGRRLVLLSRLRRS
ncbi:MAG: class I SAM-dependent methyltransferase, partial [Elusimicrobia bacterium]|nr:class I SAM-dependent methyltransferase [Elusimicrobiota bacterium]